MDIKVLKPQHPALRKFIRHFYFLRSETPDFKQSYVTFPQLTIPVSLFAHVRTHVAADRRQIMCWDDPNLGPHAEVDGIFTRPILITYKGKIDEVTVVFEPLGLNQFLNCDLVDVAVGPASRDFNPYGPEFDQFLKHLFALNSIDQRCRLLEAFFLDHYRPFAQPVLSHSFKSLIDSDHKMPISQIARSVGVSHKTLTRMFQRHMGATPVVLRKIARFRRSLELRVGPEAVPRLTQIALLSNYYDQPQFIKEYRYLTGESPTSFFRHVSAIGNKNIFWRML